MSVAPPRPSPEHALDDLRERVDRSSRVPLYYQLQDILYHAIRSRRWSPGDKLPNESELSSALRVSRAVVREALKILEDDGEIIRRQGLGTFVADPRLDHVAGGLVGFAASDVPGRAAVEILGASAVNVDEELHQMLGAKKALRVDWLLRHGGEPLAVAYSYLPLERLTAFTDSLRVGQPLHPVDLARLGIDEPIESEVSVLTSVAAAYPAEQLGVPSGSPIFVVSVTEKAAVGGDLVIVEFARVVYRSDRASLRLEAAASGQASGIVTRIVSIDR